VNGKLGDLKAVYTGGYLVRNVDQAGDYTNYARGVYADYYQCYGRGPRQRAQVDLLLAELHLARRGEERAPAARNPREHAGRLAHSRDRRRVLRGQQALRPDRLDVQDRSGVHLERRAGHPGNTGCLSDVGTFTGTTVQNPGVQSNNTSFYQDQVRDTRQTAIFASADVDLIRRC